MDTNIQEIEQHMLENRRTDTLVFGMGCFWSPDANFGQLPGVLHTRVGFAGGTKLNPTYRQMGDHTETVEITYDLDMVSLEELLRKFWQNHNPNRPVYKERQYISLLLYRNADQKRVMEMVKLHLETEQDEAIYTEIAPLHQFTEAEPHHQKYYLKRFKRATEQLMTCFPDEANFHHSTIVARLNGFVREYGTLAAIKQEVTQWDISEEEILQLQQLLNRLKW
ncbi:peptide-methionine (S)-S-oxide reductase [Terribacillus sp. DMT04]|uniref:peptide-methionine (S)-S-oxide reductase MsrA n=1 Tax=Terribacillus sp. DMT04 TaxID=2850441 RepID=UPI001C2C3B72|nr:peptide-methionine (S)-S-oxide reductase [Terribacillus sp. DMT04]QXE01388.1 peptide-methionine (S)-S-oxide reductase [Terribacillus sp. DMT04]